MALRASLYYGGKGHRSRILGEFWNMIGQEWKSCLVEVYTTVKSPLMENLVHGWKNELATNMAALFWRGVLRRLSFLDNLKALDKKLDLLRTLTWVKHYLIWTVTSAASFPLWHGPACYATKLGSHSCYIQDCTCNAPLLLSPSTLKEYYVLGFFVPFLQNHVPM
jgi:hypothetical protein